MRLTTQLTALLLAAVVVEAANSHNGHRRHHAKSERGSKGRSTNKSIDGTRKKTIPKTQQPAAKGSSNSTSSSGKTVASGSPSSSGKTVASGSSSSSGNSTVSSGTTSNSGISSNSTSTNSTSSSKKPFASTGDSIQRSDVMLGFLPDEGDAGGQRQTMAQLNALMTNGKSATYGYYAQAKSGTPFDGSQLLAVMDDVKASGSIFEPAVMPTGGWQGLTAQDNSQAVRICKVMKQFTDAGIETRLRFAHEVNFYQTDGTYQGTADDFKKGWAAVSSACKQEAPAVKMFFTPNVASMDEYQRFYPDDKDSVDFCGIDFYPKSVGSTTFVDNMKAFHDFCTSNGKTMFAIGETGLGFEGSVQDRIAWLNQATSVATKKAMPNLVSVSWFNFHKGYDFRLLAPGDSQINTAFLNFLA